MRTTTLGAVLASFAITAGAAAVLTAAPAHAATPVQVTLSLDGKSQVVAPYKAFVGGFFSGAVSYTLPDSSTAPVTAGDAVLQRRLPGKAWQDVRTDPGPDSLDYGTYGSHANGNTQYRVHYLGGTDGTTTWDPAFSAPVTVLTLWDLNEHGSCVGHCRFYGHLSPRAKHHTVTIQVKHGSWKTYKVVKTDARSRWSAAVVATFGKGTYYRAVVRGTKNEVATASGVYRFYKVRTSHPLARAAASRP
jgi:hypothetical protein